MVNLTEKELQAILNTLENIEVKGFDNMNKLMAVIGLLRKKEKEENAES